MIVGVFPRLHGLLQLPELQLSHVAIMKLFGIRSLCPLHMAIKLGRSGGRAKSWMPSAVWA